MTSEREIQSILNNEKLSTEKVGLSIAQHVLTPEVIGMGFVSVTVSTRKGYEIRAQQCPLDMYYNRKQLGDQREEGKARYRAGDRFYRDFYTAGITQGMTIDFNRVYSVDKREYLPVNDRQRECLDSWRAAYKAVSGIPGKFIAVNVLCYGYPLSSLDIPNYRDPARAMPRLLEVLDDLVTHYGLDSCQSIRHNGAESNSRLYQPVSQS